MAPPQELSDEVKAALYVALGRVPGATVHRDFPLARLTALRVGGPADLLVVVRDAVALAGSIELAGRVEVPWRMLWPFEPTIARDDGAIGIVFHPGEGFEALTQNDDGTVTLGAATPFAALTAAGPGFETLARWPGTPGSLLSSGRAPLLAGACAAITACSGARVRRRTFSATDVPTNPSRTTVPVSITLRPVSPTVHPPAPPCQLLEPEATLAEAGATAEEVAWVLHEQGLPHSRLRGWSLSQAWPGVVRQLGGGTSADLELLARGVADKLLRERGMDVRFSPSVWGRTAMPQRRRSRK